MLKNQAQPAIAIACLILVSFTPATYPRPIDRLPLPTCLMLATLNKKDPFPKKLFKIYYHWPSAQDKTGEQPARDKTEGGK
ncbi:MAG: hypothetical protein M1549_03930 [Candidatus Dependentiae bacterium]|nr:hypothetical protein [Candidatus Dependentiae bacterium]